MSVARTPTGVWPAKRDTTTAMPSLLGPSISPGRHCRRRTAKLTPSERRYGISGRQVILPAITRVERRACALAAAMVVVASIAGCAGPTPAGARQKVDDALASFQLSSTNIQLSPKVAAAFATVDQTLLVPSYIYGDTSKWTASAPDTRTLTIGATFRDGHYDVVPDSAAPADLGASRRIVRLQRFGRQQFRWTMFVEQALGSLTVEDLDRAIRAILGQAAQMTNSVFRAAETARYPRTAAALSRLLSLDSLVTRRDSLRTRIRLIVGVNIARLASTYPHYAAALRTTAEPTRIHAVATDDLGAEWLRLDFGGGRFALEIATTPTGHVAPLGGPLRPLPDSLTLHTDYSTKMSMFSFGVRDLVSHITLFDRAHVYGARLVFTREPTWDFPLALDRLVTAPLARPFADSGARYELLVADTVGRQTEFQQRYEFDVEESPILRWLNRVSAHLNTAFSDSATAELNAFFANFLAAARADIRAESAFATDQRDQ